MELFRRRCRGDTGILFTLLQFDGSRHVVNNNIISDRDERNIIINHRHPNTYKPPVGNKYPFICGGYELPYIFA